MYALTLRLRCTHPPRRRDLTAGWPADAAEGVTREVLPMMNLVQRRRGAAGYPSNPIIVSGSFSSGAARRLMNGKATRVIDDPTVKLSVVGNTWRRGILEVDRTKKFSLVPKDGEVETRRIPFRP